MNYARILLNGTVLGLALTLAGVAPSFAEKTTPTAAPAAASVDFGDDTSEWAKDGECDDPRFVGAAAAAELVDADIKHDATDCKAAFETGKVTLKDATTTAEPATPAAPAAPATPDVANTPAAVDFGDDSSKWAKDGECDDPRFTGNGSAEELEAADIKKDATDCKAAFDAGTVTLKDGGTPANTPTVATAPTAIEYGDDTSEWSKDGECDDPRFTGTGVAEGPSNTDIKKDATDCEAAVKAGTATLKDGGTPTTNTPVADDQTPTTPTTPTTVAFGDDSGQWPKDGECDDPRFTGAGAAEAPEDVDTMKDATDCKTAFDAGTVTLKTAAVDTPTVAVGDVDFGDDAGQYPKDGECDDPRFAGTAAADEPEAVDIKHDATDCKAAFGAGTVTLKGDGTTAAVDFGNDSSKYANDGECDDPRFTGEGTDKKLLAEDKMADATDCQSLLTAGKVSLRPIYDPAYAAGAPYDAGTIDFGDNTSSYANDTECDDPRFEGPGLADSPVAENKWHDHDDCLAAFQNGTVALKL